MTPRNQNPGPARRLSDFDYSDATQTFFVTACARAGTTPFTDTRLARITIDALEWLRSNRDVRLYAYCLMPDHLHLLLQLGDADRPLGMLIGSLKRFTTRASWGLGYTGQLWQSRFYDHVMRTDEDGKRIAQYIVDNPARKGLMREGEVYPWSGNPDPMV